MKKLRLLALTAAAGFCLLAGSTRSHAQVGVSIGVAPECPYGYYDYPPYGCAPYGYYGPEWFSGGVFVGAGPWYRGGHEFYGHVDNHFDPHHGYRGEFPHRGEHADKDHRIDRMEHFRGNEMRDGRGHSHEH